MKLWQLMLVLLTMEMGVGSPFNFPITEKEGEGFSTLIDTERLSRDARVIKMQEVLDTTTANFFFLCLSETYSRGFFRDWTLDMRIDYFRAALTKPSSEYPKSLHYDTSHDGVRAAILHCIKDAGGEFPPYETIVLSEPEWREKLVKLLDEAKTRLHPDWKPPTTSGSPRAGALAHPPTRGKSSPQESGETDYKSAPEAIQYWIAVPLIAFCLTLVSWLVFRRINKRKCGAPKE